MLLEMQLDLRSGTIGALIGTDGDGVNDENEGNVISEIEEPVSFWRGQDLDSKRLRILKYSAISSDSTSREVSQYRMLWVCELSIQLETLLAEEV